MKGLLVLAALAAGFTSFTATAQSQPIEPTGAVAIPPAPFPADRVGLPVYEGDGCTSPTFDDRRAPSVELVSRTTDVAGREFDVYDYVVEYRMRDPQLSSTCVTPPAPGFRGYFDAGSLPLGTHNFVLRGVYRGVPYVEYRVAALKVTTAQRLPADVSGAWAIADQPGRGVIVTRGVAFGLFFATHDLAGKPTWLAMNTAEGAANAVREGEAITTQGRAFGQPGAVGSSAWGTLRFEYTGCKRAKIAWNAVDPAFGSGTADLVQVLQADGTPVCEAKPLIGPPLEVPRQ